MLSSIIYPTRSRKIIFLFSGYTADPCFFMKYNLAASFQSYLRRANFWWNFLPTSTLSDDFHSVLCQNSPPSVFANRFTGNIAKYRCFSISRALDNICQHVVGQFVIFEENLSAKKSLLPTGNGECLGQAGWVIQQWKVERCLVILSPFFALKEDSLISLSKQINLITNAFYFWHSSVNPVQSNLNRFPPHVKQTNGWNGNLPWHYIDW